MTINTLPSAIINHSLPLKKDQDTLATVAEQLKSRNTENSKVDKEKAQNVAKEFETMFVDLMLKSMRNTAKPAEESNAQEIYSSFLDQEYAKAMTERENFGIRDMVYNYITGK